MKQAQKLTNAISVKLGIPTEILSREPTVTVKGRAYAVVEPHGGVERFTPEEICVRACGGRITITGSKLDVTRMNGQAIEISGEIDGVCFQEAAQ